MITPSLREFLWKALHEDMPYGDITTLACVPEGHQCKAKVIAKEPLVVCGVEIAIEVFKLLSESIEFSLLKRDSEDAAPEETIFTLEGPTRAILSGERVALNILQRLSGIATLTRRFVSQLKDTQTRLLDTRKTTPLMRDLEKYAVRTGGGYNHRFSLSDAILIKDNHIKAAGGISRAIERARAYAGPTTTIEVEVENLEQLKEALQAGADMIMLDNMDISEIKEALQLCRKMPQVKVEVSGGVTLENIRDIASTGVDFVSVGAITHSAKASDISLEID